MLIILNSVLVFLLVLPVNNVFYHHVIFLFNWLKSFVHKMKKKIVQFYNNIINSQPLDVKNIHVTITNMKSEKLQIDLVSSS